MFSRSRRNVIITEEGMPVEALYILQGVVILCRWGWGGGGESYSPSSPMVYKLFFSFLYSYLIDTSEVSGIVSQDYSPWFVGSI